MVNDGVLTWKAHHTLYLALLVRNYGQHSLPSLLPQYISVYHISHQVHHCTIKVGGNQKGRQRSSVSQNGMKIRRMILIIRKYHETLFLHKQPVMGLNRCSRPLTWATAMPFLTDPFNQFIPSDWNMFVRPVCLGRMTGAHHRLFRIDLSLFYPCLFIAMLNRLHHA